MVRVGSGIDLREVFFIDTQQLVIHQRVLVNRGTEVQTLRAHYHTWSHRVCFDHSGRLIKWITVS